MIAAPNTNFTMGRNTTKQTRALPRADRARLAKETMNKTIPSLLTSSPRARAGVTGAHLLRDLPSATGTVSQTSKPTIRVIESDTFDAAQALHTSYPSGRIAVLSIASPLRPGGGVLTGATSQEESLCMRSTLFPSLRDEFYRLPENALIYTPDILVFRAQDLSPLPKSDRFYVDVISCAALRFPEVQDGKYVVEADRETMVKKIRLILRAAVMKGCKRIVLGALGCGAYANPVREVAEMFRRVICGNSKRNANETWGSIEEIVFAIRGGKDTTQVFREVLQTIVEMRPDPGV
jgi:uncharacterized protein (TIGR02452 family)